MSGQQVVDVKYFFNNLIRDYSIFGNSAERLATQIATIPSEHLKDRCDELFNERIKLSHLDNQLIEIIRLAGKELSDDQLISQYRDVFSKATKAVDEVKNQLLLRRKSIEQAPVKH